MVLKTEKIILDPTKKALLIEGFFYVLYVRDFL